jgi:hypothetical protein
MRVGRMWNTLKLKISAGVAHDRKERLPGDLAQFCIACPQQNFNLPANWEADYKDKP